MIRVYKTKTEIGFHVIGDIWGQITEWNNAIDVKVFEEQLATGRITGSPDIDSMLLQPMREFASQGVKRPYYGCSSANALVYHFRVTGPQVALTLEHDYTHESILLKAESPPASSGEPSGTARFRIGGSEYARLVDWPHWDDAQALSERYEYIFSDTALGSTSKVKDATSGELVDLTDYEGW